MAMAVQLHINKGRMAAHHKVHTARRINNNRCIISSKVRQWGITSKIEDQVLARGSAQV